MMLNTLVKDLPAFKEVARAARKIIGVTSRSWAKDEDNTDITKSRVFFKMPSCLIPTKRIMSVHNSIDDGTCRQWSEVKLGILIGNPGKKIHVANAMHHVAGFCVCLDIGTYERVVRLRSPLVAWEKVDGYDTPTGVGQFIPKEQVQNPFDIDLWLRINGELIQKGNTKDMKHNLAETVSFVSRFFPLQTGDLVLSDCPPGHYACAHPGQVLEAGVGKVNSIEFKLESK